MDRIRLGVVGAGWWATLGPLPALKRRPDVELVAVCRLGKEELERVRDVFSVPFATQDFDEMLERVPMEGLLVTSPHALHGEQTLKGLKRELHVLVEKPMATDVAEARAITEFAQKAALHVVVPYGWNFGPQLAAARDWVKNGCLGSVRHISAQMTSPLEELMTGNQRPGTENHMFRPNPQTWANPESGGYGWGQLVHLLGAIFFLADLSPEGVTALVGRSEMGADLYDAAAIRFASGATAAVSGSATAPAGSPFQLDIRLFGSEGMLLIDTERERIWLRRRNGDKKEIAMPPVSGAHSPLEAVHRFVDLCRGKSVENCGGPEIGLRTVQVVDAMLRSASSAKFEPVA